MKKPDLKIIDPHSLKCRDYFDGQYSKNETYWGDQPNLIVPLLSSHVRPGSRVLVIGCGEGRDAVFLARFGFDVVATEISNCGLDRAKKSSSSNSMKLELINLDAHESHAHLGRFDAVLMMNVIQFLKPDRIRERIEHFKSLVKPGGVFGAQLFTVDDPLYKKAVESKKDLNVQKAIEHPKRKYNLRFFEKGELFSYFQGWEMIYYHEGLMWDKPHGIQSDFHQHGFAQMIARKK